MLLVAEVIQGGSCSLQSSRCCFKLTGDVAIGPEDIFKR